MSNEQCTVTIADIYGAEWWERNKAELDREWEYGLGIATKGQTFVCLWSADGINDSVCSSPRYEVRIILHRRKPKHPTLREVYGTDEVTIPQGWEWTGEWRVPVKDEWYVANGTKMALQICSPYIPASPRLILRERPKKVWFKAEEKCRLPRNGEWIWTGDYWIPAKRDFVESEFICATRHEEVDQTVQVVTQAMVDGVVK